VTDLADTLTNTWRLQSDEGFLLSDSAGIEERILPDEPVGVAYRLRWMPHREIRSDTAELERRGILNPNRRDDILFRDPRDPSGRHCFLCSRNIAECNPMERLVPVRLAGRDYLIGANFAWIEQNHFTVMAAEHIDQDFTPHVLDAMVDLYRRAGGEYRVLYNGAQAGATIPWHLHYQITTERLPVEDLPEGNEPRYPAALRRIQLDGDGTLAALAEVNDWIAPDPEHRRVNVLVTGNVAHPTVHVFARDRRLSHAAIKGLMGGFEICGDLIYSEPDKRTIFETATTETARRAIAEVRPADTWQ
jgi:hypothetical protein